MGVKRGRGRGKEGWTRWGERENGPRRVGVGEEERRVDERGKGEWGERWVGARGKGQRWEKKGWVWRVERGGEKKVVEMGEGIMGVNGG